MRTISILFLTIVIASFIASCDARSRSELQKALGNAHSKIRNVEHKLNQAHTDCNKFKAS